MGIRKDRVQRALAKEISTILQEDLKDPRIGFITITRIEITQDLRYAKIYFSILGDEDKKAESVSGLDSASSYIRKLVGGRLGLRYVPELAFILDKSVEYTIALEETLKKIKDEDDNKQGS